MDANEAKFFGALLIAVSVIGMVLVFFIVTIVRYHNLNMRLYKEKIALEIATLEKERARIASDLHDHLGPMLSAVKLKASVVEGKSEQDKAVINGLKEHVDDIVNSIRNISNALRPTVLDRLGLVKAIGDHVDQLNDLDRMQIVFRGCNSSFTISADAELHIFRIVQEALNNALKHAEASTCAVALQRNNTMLRLTVSDNGKGFEFKQCLQAGRSCGLKNIVNRVEVLKGTLTADTKPGEGTAYIIDIPIKQYEQRENQSGYRGRSRNIPGWPAASTVEERQDHSCR